MPGRLIVVANKLPINVNRSANGSFDLSMSGGGLVAGITGFSKTTQLYWFGWPGMAIPPQEVDVLTSRLKQEFNAVPVLLDDELADEYYNGFSNSILWPLFHYHPGDTFKKQLWNMKLWTGYQEANRHFAHTIAPHIADNDLIWIHDFHLMLLPQMLREEISNKKKKVNVKIGFFLHIPFPSSEIYRILPVRKQLLEGMLYSDLIGFHTPDYTRHFLSSCLHILNLHPAAGNPNALEFQSKLVTIGTFPIGIDPSKCIDGLETPAVQARLCTLELKFHGIKVMIGVERLDYIKGVPQKLHAFKLFLTEHPEWIGRVVLIQIAVPSRLYIQEYRDLRAETEELVSRINGEFGSIDFMPVQYLHKTVPFDELLALYAVSDVCLVSSMRDGMNLVSFEYLASQSKRRGSLIISEFAGAAQGFVDGGIVANPWNVEELAGAIYQAVTMDGEQRDINCKKLEEYVKTYTSTRWGETFVQELTKPAAILRGDETPTENLCPGVDGDVEPSIESPAE